MKFIVESTSVTDWLPVLVAPPEGGGSGLAVGTTGARPPGR